MKKCEKCGTEYDENKYNDKSIFCRCPLCKRKLTKKERIKEIMWNTVFSITAFAIGLLFLFGANAAFGYTPATFLFVIVGGLYFIALDKRKTARKEKTITAISKILDDPKYNTLNILEKNEIIYTISKEVKK